jgi:phage host-nuclease inhibitor protein Gam
MVERAQELLGDVTLPVVERELRKIGEAELELERLQGRLDADMAAVTVRHEPGIRAARQKVDDLKARLQVGVSGARETLFQAGTQTLKLGLGRVSYRRAPDRIEVAEGLEVREVIRRMQRARKRQYYKVTYGLDKAALNKAASAGLLDEGALEGLGLLVVRGEESWTVKTDHEAVREAVGKG